MAKSTLSSGSAYEESDNRLKRIFYNAVRDIKALATCMLQSTVFVQRTPVPGFPTFLQKDDWEASISPAIDADPQVPSIKESNNPHTGRTRLL